MTTTKRGDPTMATDPTMAYELTVRGTSDEASAHTVTARIASCACLVTAAYTPRRPSRFPRLEFGGRKAQPARGQRGSGNGGSTRRASAIGGAPGPPPGGPPGEEARRGRGNNKKNTSPRGSPGPRCRCGGCRGA